MPDYPSEIVKIRDPRSIHEALYASGPNALMRALERDQTVGNLIEGGPEVVPLIAAELEEHGLDLHWATLCALAYVLQRTDLDAAVRILRPLFERAMEAPDPFFVHFAAHTLRQGMGLRVDPLDPEYTRSELRDTLKRIRGL